MDEWAGVTLTGRQYREPAATLHEAENTHGLKHTIIAYDAAYRGHPAISRDVELISSFLEYPMVVGLVEMSHRDVSAGRFGYPTGTYWTLHELQRIHADLSLKIGLRAGLELAYLCGQILVEAADNGSAQGCFSHGGLTPWRIGIRAEGDVIVFGHGLPQVDVLCHQADPSFAVSPDSLRYAPPERLTGQPEGIAADTAALTAIVYEVITGHPLYAGHDVEHVSRAVAMAEGAAILGRPSELPRAVAQVFAQGLTFDPDTRLTGERWVAAVGDLYERHQEGESLAAIGQRVSGSRTEGPRRPARLVATQTTQFTPEQLRSAVAALDEPDEPAATEAPKQETRWTRPSRRRADGSAGATGATGAAVATGVTAVPPLGGATTAARPGGEPEEAPRRRRRLRADGTVEPSTEAFTAPVSGAQSTVPFGDDDDDDDPADPSDAGRSETSGVSEAVPRPPADPRPRRRADVASEAPPGRRRRRRPDE